MGKNGTIKKILKPSLETMLDAEMTEHFGYEKRSPVGIHSGNNRNGKTPKKVQSDNGTLVLEIPRDRNGEFELIVVRKGESRLGVLEDKFISMPT